MSRECNQCGSDSPPGSRFCMNCGTPLIKKQVRENTSAAGWWSSQNNGVKALTLVGACCVGMIVLVGIIGLLSPDASTSSYPGSSTVLMIVTVLMIIAVIILPVVVMIL